MNIGFKINLYTIYFLIYYYGYYISSLVVNIKNQVILINHKLIPPRCVEKQKQLLICPKT